MNAPQAYIFIYYRRYIILAINSLLFVTCFHLYSKSTIIYIT